MKVADPTARLGEDAACDFLTKKGYRIIERNFRKGYGEIDIIALDHGILAFVEVKTRTSSVFGHPFEAIGHWKLRVLVRTAEYYKLIHPELPDQLRIDAVSVTLTNGKPQIELIKNISGF